MNLVVIGDLHQLDSWKAMTPDQRQIAAWLPGPTQLPADAFVLDLSFDGSPERVRALAPASFCLVNSVTLTCTELPAHFARFNGWPGFTGSGVTEAACQHDAVKQSASAILAVFGKVPEWVPDIPGLVAPRIVSMIINEAFFALQENVSTREAVDTAMKLGTNYPYGPFAWCSMIGARNIVTLLEKLALQEERYAPAAALRTEAEL